MTEHSTFQKQLNLGLRALAVSSFPKRCPACGRTYETAEQFLTETRRTGKAHAGQAEDGTQIVEAFRQCPCGSALADVFTDRRDNSKAGVQRRQRFDDLLILLEDNGVDRDTARTELIKVMRGIPSEVLSRMNLPA